jgi:archaellum component FlaC
MSVSEILHELDRLSADELQVIREKLNLLDEQIEETPEMLAAIDEGLRSLKEEGTIPIEELEKRLASWNTASP